MMTDLPKIALAQMRVIPNEPQRNIDTMIEMGLQAAREDCHIIAFPELAVGGYLVGDNVWNADERCEDLMRYNAPLEELSKKLAVIWGNIFLDTPERIKARTGSDALHPNKDGRTRKYNAAYAWQNGLPVPHAVPTRFLPRGVQPKLLLPTYRFFDDQRYFFSLEDIAKDWNVPLKSLAQPFVFDIDGEKLPIGLEVCEDLWCEDYRKALQPLNVSKMLQHNGAKAIINISASPWTWGKNGARDRRIRFLGKDNGGGFIPFYYVNNVGPQNNGKNVITFDGGSTIYNGEGLPVVMGPVNHEQALITVTQENLRSTPVVRVERNRIEAKHDAIIAGLRYIRDMTGWKNHPRWVLGMSGGVDSALEAALLVDAFGKENVLGVNMPSRYNSKATQDLARQTAAALGIKYVVIPIEELVQVNAKLLDDCDPWASGAKLSELNRENVQAKIRGTSLLSNLAAKFGALMTNNGNKLEVALGYATLYGDWNGAIAPLADLTKTEVVCMARWYNARAGKEIIPEALLPDPLWTPRKELVLPTAELKANQIDPMKFGYHCGLIDLMVGYKRHTQADIMQYWLDGTLHKQIDRVMEGLFDQPVGLGLMKRWGMEKGDAFVDDLRWFDRLVQINVFKRVQAPPIIVTSKAPFGYDVRESILPYTETLTQAELAQEIKRVGTYKPTE